MFLETTLYNPPTTYPHHIQRWFFSLLWWTRFPGLAQAAIHRRKVHSFSPASPTSNRSASIAIILTFIVFAFPVLTTSAGSKKRAATCGRSEGWGKSITWGTWATAVYLLDDGTLATAHFLWACEDTLEGGSLESSILERSESNGRWQIGDCWIYAVPLLAF